MIIDRLTSNDIELLIKQFQENSLGYCTAY